MTKDEALKLALEALELHGKQYPHMVKGYCLDAITALREALAEQPAQQDSTCSNALRAQGKAYPRTCKKCGLGPCVELAQQALDKKAENARELGLDYEPAKDNSNYRFDPPGLDPSHQKPVAWWIPKAKQFCLPSSDGTRPFAKAWEPLYTSPPAQRKPLTDEQIDAIWDAVITPSNHIREFVRAIEATLREQNTP